MSTFDTPQFDPVFVAAVSALNAHCGGGATVGSGYRDTAHQARLYNDYINGVAGQAMAAPPGTSRHEGNHGGAFDLQFANDQVKACMHDNANAFGLGFDVPGEDWHIQLSADGEAAIANGTFGEQFGVTADGNTDEPQAAPDSLDGIRAIIFGQAGPENPVDVPQRVEQAFAPHTTPTVTTSPQDAPETFTPQASAGFSSDGSALSAVDVARFYAQAGFTGDALVTMVAISKGESGWNPGANGDTSITDGTWGPSMGLSQIRSLNDQRGTGGWRDPTRLSDPLFNARAAYAISNGGTNFGPWTVYSQGIYNQYLSEARAAVAALGTGAIAGQGPPAASIAPPADDVADPVQGLFDPVGITQDIADMVLAQRQTSPQERVTDQAAENEADAADLLPQEEPRRGRIRSMLGGTNA